MPLIAFDGTWIPSWLRPRPSNTKQFCSAYRAHPDNRGLVLYIPRWRSLFPRHAMRRAYRWLDKKCDGDVKVDIIGYGRGACLAVRLSQVIGDYGVGRPQRRIASRSPLSFWWHLERSPSDSSSVRFLGLWDMAIRSRKRNRSDLSQSNRPTRTFHVMALDEYQRRHKLVRLPEGRDYGAVDSVLREVWHAGNHTDMGALTWGRHWSGAARLDRPDADVVLNTMMAEAHRIHVDLNVAALGHSRSSQASSRPWLTTIAGRRLALGLAPREFRPGDLVHRLDARREMEEASATFDPATARTRGRARLIRFELLTPSEPRALGDDCRSDETPDDGSVTRPFAYVSIDGADERRVKKFVDALSEEVPLGSRLDGASAVIVLWTLNSINSATVARDVERTVVRELPVVQVTMDGVTPPLGFRSQKLFEVTGGHPDPAEIEPVTDVVNEILAAARSDQQPPKPTGRYFAADEVRATLSAKASAVDAPAVDDTLNRRPLAAVVTARLKELQPLARDRSVNVLIEGPWGSGKSTLVNFIEKEINPNPKETKWLFVRFDAWRQERAGPSWWALMETLRREVIDSKSARGRASFWFRERWAVLGPAHFTAVALVVVVLALVIIVGSLDAVAGFMAWIAATLTGLAVLWATLLVMARFVTFDPARKARVLMDTSRNPMEVIAERFRWLAAEAKRPVVIVIDDLDRCDHAYVVEMLDAIQTLTRDAVLSSRRRRHRSFDLFVVVAADEAWLRQSYQERHSSLLDVVEEPGRGLGDLFLAKIFDFMVAVPEPPEDLRQSYLVDLLGGQEEEVQDVNEIVQQVRDLAQRIVEATTENEILTVLDDTSDMRLRGLLGGQVLDRLNAPDIQASTDTLLRDYGSLLGGNPRVIKRFVLDYRVSRALLTVSGESPGRNALAMWSILRVRLPALAQSLQDDPDLLAEWQRPWMVRNDFGAALRCHPDVARELRLVDVEDMRKCVGSLGRQRRPEGAAASTWAAMRGSVERRRRGRSVGREPSVSMSPTLGSIGRFDRT